MTKDRFPRGKTAIVGASTYGMGESPGLSSMDLAVNASVRALDQVGLTPGDVDGLFIGLPDDFLFAPLHRKDQRRSRLGAHDALHIVEALDRIAIDRAHHVAGLETGRGGGAIFLDAVDARALDRLA